MSNNNRGATFHCPIQCLLNNFLTLFIQCRRSLVKDQNLWVLNQGSCDSDTLLLATGEFTALEAAYLEEAWMKALLLGLDLTCIN